MFTITGTGPRDWNTDNDHMIIERLMQLKAHAVECNEERVVVLSGGARGYDAALANVAKGLNIETFILFPNKSYIDYYWLGGDGNPADLSGLKKMCEGANVLPPVTQYVYVYYKDGTRKHANFVRNEVMVDRATVVLVGADNKSQAFRSPGTREAVKYAENSDKPIWYMKDESVPEIDVPEAQQRVAFDPWSM